MSEQKTNWKLMLPLMLISGIAGGLILTVVTLTRPIIAENRAKALQKAVVRLVPEVRAVTPFNPDLLPPREGEQALFYLGIDGSGAGLAIFVPTSGQGYQDVIRLLVAYDYHKKEMLGFQVLESKETPGLGDRIEKDITFTGQFYALPFPQILSLAQRGRPKTNGQIDGITGATVSSKAVVRILSQLGTKNLPGILTTQARWEP